MINISNVKFGFNYFANGLENSLYKAFNKLATLPYKLDTDLYNYFQSSNSSSSSDLLALCPHVSEKLVNASKLVQYLISEMGRGVDREKINPDFFGRVGLQKPYQSRSVDRESTPKSSVLYDCYEASLGQTFRTKSPSRSFESSSFSYGHTPHYDRNQPTPNRLNICLSDAERLKKLEIDAPFCHRQSLLPNPNEGVLEILISKKNGDIDYSKKLFHKAEHSGRWWDLDSWQGLLGFYPIDLEVSCSSRKLQCRVKVHNTPTSVKVIEQEGQLFISGQVRDMNILEGSPLSFDSAEEMIGFIQGKSTVYHYALPLLTLLGSYLLYKGFKSLFGNRSAKVIPFRPTEESTTSKVQ